MWPQDKPDFSRNSFTIAEVTVMELFHLADAAEMMKCVFVGVRSESRIELNMTPSLLQLHNNHVTLAPADSSSTEAYTAKTSMFYKTRELFVVIFFVL